MRGRGEHKAPRPARGGQFRSAKAPLKRGLSLQGGGVRGAVPVDQAVGEVAGEGRQAVEVLGAELEGAYGPGVEQLAGAEVLPALEPLVAGLGDDGDAGAGLDHAEDGVGAGAP